ncbi:MAG: AAA family ATPase, partial [Armatimonadota bacterium]
MLGSAANPEVIAVTSGKGGVGKTTLSVNLAAVLAASSRRVLIVDADLGLSNVDVVLGLRPARHLGHLLLPEYQAEDVAVEAPGNLVVISGGSGVRELAEARDAERGVLLDKLADYYGTFDFVVIDTSPGIGRNVTDFLVASSKVLLLTSSEPTSLRDTYAAAKTISRVIEHQRIWLIINQVGCESEAEAVFRTLNGVTCRFLGWGFAGWDWIEAEPAFRNSAMDHRPLVLSHPGSSACRALRRIANAITSRAGRDNRNAERGGVVNPDEFAVLRT